MKSFYLSFFTILFLLTGCQGQNTKTLHTVDATTFSEKLKTAKNPQLLDVRTPQEFAQDHIDQAININWNGEDFVAKASAYDKSQPIFVYCKIGGRSIQAATKLVELGFTEVYNLEGGIMKWNASGMGKASDKIIGMCSQEFDELLQSDTKVVVNFYAEWCGPCKKMTPYLIKLQEELKGKITIARLDADKNKTLVDALKLDSLPVIIVYENGKETWRHVGYLAEDDLKKHL